jgi:nicotinate-nucleotide adenylyltransferase
MFDPPHLGHIAGAKYAAQQLELDTVKLIPCKLPNHRAQTQASTAHRLNMLNIAIQAEPLLSVDTLELERAGISYMIDTVATLRDRNPTAQIILIMGVDSFNSLPSWHRYEEILSLCHLYVLSRDAQAVSQETKRKLLKYGAEVENKQQLFTHSTGCYLFDVGFDHIASSTLVRQDRASGKNFGALLDPAVAQYIESHHLYQETTLIKERCTG